MGLSSATDSRVGKARIRPLERGNKAVVGDEDERCYLNGEVKGEIWMQVWCDALADGNGVAGLGRREWRLIEIVGDWDGRMGKWKCGV